MYRVRTGLVGPTSIEMRDAVMWRCDSFLFEGGQGRSKKSKTEHRSHSGDAFEQGVKALFLQDVFFFSFSSLMG